MSYILEALKRADAERQRGGVPGLHDQTGRGVTAAEPGGASGRPWALAGAALALLLIGAAVAGWWRSGPVAPSGVVSGAPALPVVLPPVPVSAAPAVPLTAAPTAAPTSAPTAAVLPPPAVASGAAARVALAAPASAPLALPASAARPLPASPATLSSQSPSTPPSTPTSAATLATPAQRAVGPLGSASAAATTASPTVPAAAPVATLPERLLQLAELPDAVRREVGPLNPGGSIYAEQPAARMVILNGQVFREGDLLAAQLRVEQIRPRSVVLSLRGQRFELAL